MERENECRRLEADLTAYHQGELPPDRAGEVEAHVADCAACRDAVRGIEGVFTMAGAVENLAPSLRLKRGLEALVRRARTPQNATLGERLSWSLAFFRHRLKTSRRFRIATVSVAANAAVLLLASLIVIPAVADRGPIEFSLDPEAYAPLDRSDARAGDQPLLSPFHEEGREPLPVPSPEPDVFRDLPPEMVQLEPLLPPAEAHERLPAAIFANVIPPERRRAAYAAAFRDPLATSSAVARGLSWLADHQKPDGSWAGSPRGPGYETGVTASVVLAFLSDGHSESRGNKEYRKVVAKALDWLIARQATGAKDPLVGLIGPSDPKVHYTYNHALATIALVEAWSLDCRRVSTARSRQLRTAVRSAISFIVKSQTPAGGWKYDAQLSKRERYENDTSVSIFMVTALTSARSARFHVPEKTFRGFAVWLRRVTGENGIVGYAKAGDRDKEPRTLTAGALFLEETLGLAAPLRDRQAKIVRAELDDAKGSTGKNCLLRFFAALAFRIRGERVLDSFTDGILAAQDPKGRWIAAPAGEPAKNDISAVYAGDSFLTAVNILTLTTSYRASN
jgi:hypothetical protein